MALRVTLGQFRLAVLGLDDFSDSEIEHLFLNLEVLSEKDISEAVGIIQVHRPELLKGLTAKYCRSPAA